MRTLKHLTVYLSLMFLGTLLPLAPAVASASGAAKNFCVQCHTHMPGGDFVGQQAVRWNNSVHMRHGITCDKCHGGNPRAADKGQAHNGVLGSGNPQSRVYYKNVPYTCGKCHRAELKKFIQSRHYRMLISTGWGPECVTCHGSMSTTILSAATVQKTCERCHNKVLGISPFVPAKARTLLLLITESKTLLDANSRKYANATGQKSVDLYDARASFDAARKNWHRFDFDQIARDLQAMYVFLERLSPENGPMKEACGHCHNAKDSVFPYVPQKAMSMLLLMRESKTLLDLDSRKYAGASAPKAVYLRDARVAFNAAVMNWHKSGPDKITQRLEAMYKSLEKLSPGSGPINANLQN